MLRRVLLPVVVLFAATVMLGCDSSTTVSSTGRSWYVSRNGNDSTGTSWASAWTEPARIDWSVVQPGDQIIIDGGSTRCPSDYGFAHYQTTRPGLRCGMLYRSGLTVGASGGPSAPITIRLSSAAGHDGTAVLFGGRSTPLPYCDQASYTPVGQARPAGITVPGRDYVVIDGTHRSGLMIYGAQAGVDLASDDTGYVTLRNLEIFDNGTYRTWGRGYLTDGEGIKLAGHDIVVDRDLIHDNGQDAIQDRDTGVARLGHAPLHDITITDTWLYEHRADPLFPGFGFNAGAQTLAAQDCTHSDGLQIWGGGLHQQRMTFDHDVFGPLIAQGVYPGDNNVTSFDRVVVSNSLFLNVLDHAIIGPAIATAPGTPGGWQVSNVTSYMTDQPNRGLDDHGKIDLSGAGHRLTNSLFYNGYFANLSSFSFAAGNVWWGGDPVPGGTHERPAFVGPLPTGNAPSFAVLESLNLTPQCAACAGVGSPLHDVTDLLQRIDSLNRTGP